MQEILQEALLKSKGSLSKELITDIESIAGGCIHNAWRLKLSDGRQLFAKTAPSHDFPKLEFEANGLLSLKRFSNEELVNIPEPLLLEKLKNFSVLLLPWLEFGNRNQRILGEALAFLHKSSTEQSPKQFGWEVDGFIGTTSQIRGWKSDWGECFIELRLIPQLKIAKKWGINLSDWSKLLSYLNIFLNEHLPKPSLVHGDLWSGNCSIQKDGKAVIFDPAVWWADREVDLAMTKLFGGFSNNFYEGYESVWPTSKSAFKRIQIYNLYHIINHANMFGGSYVNQSISTLQNIQSQI